MEGPLFPCFAKTYLGIQPGGAAGQRGLQSISTGLVQVSRSSRPDRFEMHAAYRCPDWFTISMCRFVTRERV